MFTHCPQCKNELIYSDQHRDWICNTFDHIFIEYVSELDDRQNFGYTSYISFRPSIEMYPEIRYYPTSFNETNLEMATRNAELIKFTIDSPTSPQQLFEQFIIFIENSILI